MRDVIAAVQAELTGLLVARSCRFDPGTPVAVVRASSGTGRSQASAPSSSSRRPNWSSRCRLGRHSVGRFLVDPTPEVIVPFDHRIVAVILTDHLAAALASDKSAASPRP